MSTVRSVEAARCATCDAPLAGPYCHGCGEPHAHQGDLALRHLLHDAVHEFTHLDGKIWRTLRALILEPGRLTKEYWEGRRGLWIRPFRLYLTIYILHLLLLPNVAGPLAFRFAAYRDEKGKAHISVGDVAANHAIDETLVNEVQHVYKWAQYASLTLFAGVTFLLYRRRQPYFGAHMILAMHFYSFENILSAVMTPVRTLLAMPPSVAAVFILIPLTYIFLMLRRVFDQNAWLTALKTVPVLLLFVIIELLTASAIVFGVTWASGHWS
jgi:Protein of unknown function (DUF3667)